MDMDSDRGLSRRDFVKAAVAIGGVSALSACQGVEQSQGGETTTATDSEPSFPKGASPEDLPERQHAWDEYLVHGSHGTTIQGQHQLLLGLSYEGSAPPTEDESEQVESALRTLERAYKWGSGYEKSGKLNDGLLFMLGYAPNYLSEVGIETDRVQSPETLLSELDQDPEKADDFDAVLLLDSDFGSIILSAEEAMFGDRERINGVEVEDRLSGIFEVQDRRSGFLGKGVPADKLDNEDIPEEAPLSMGFRSGFVDGQAPEDLVTIDEGPFAGGTTFTISRLKTHLDEWYDQPHEDRAKEMYCPAHDVEEDIGETGSKLGATSGITPENVENMDELAEEHDIVGHSQKVATARNEDFVPKILRRSEGVATDETGGSAFNFSAIQQDTRDFVETRSAMHVDEYDVDVPDENHGIVDYLETIARGTFLVPPRSRRALPAPR